MAFKFGEKLRQFLGVAAPVILKSTLGPLGGIAGTFVQKALGVDSDEAAVAALETDPAALGKLREAELAFKAHLSDNAIAEEQLVIVDRKDARDREIAVRDRTPAQLAWLIIGGFLGITAAQLAAMIGFADQVAKIPPQGWLLIGNVSGYLANEAKQAAAYYFGSSAGSKAKDETIATLGARE